MNRLELRPKLSFEGNTTPLAPSRFSAPNNLKTADAFHLHFGKNSGFDEKDMKEMGGERPPGLLQQIPRGALHLDKMSKALEVAGLSDSQKANLDGFGQLIRIGMRDQKNTGPKMEAAYQNLLNDPTPAMASWMEKLELTVEDFRKPVVDIDAIAKSFYTPSETLLRMDKLGLFALKAPEELELKDGTKFPVGGVHLSNSAYHYLVSEYLAPMNMGSLLVPISANNSIGNNPLALYGSEAQQKKYFPKLAQSEYLAAFGLTEPGAGTDTKRVDTRAQLSEDGKHWVLNGSKLFITNTQRAGLLYLVAKTSKRGERDQYTTFMVDLPFRLTDSLEDFKTKQAQLMDPNGSEHHTSGQMSISDPLEMGVIPGSNQAHIVLKDFKIPIDNVLGGSGKLTELPLEQLMRENPDKPLRDILTSAYVEEFSQTYEGTDRSDKAIKKAFAQEYLGQVGSGRKIPFDALALGRNGFGSSGYGAAMRRIEQAGHRALTREAPNDFVPRDEDREGVLGDLPDVQRMLTESLITASGIGAVTDLTSALIDYHAPNNTWNNSEMDLAAEAITAKVMGADGAWDVGVNTQQILGGQGLFEEHPGAYFRTFTDLWVNRIVEGVHAGLEQWLTLKALQPYAEMAKSMAQAAKTSNMSLLKVFAKNGVEFKNMKFNDSGDTGGGLSSQDVRWLRSRTRKMNLKVAYTGARLGKKMETAQPMNMRIAKASMDIFAITAALLKLKTQSHNLPESHKLALEAFIERSKANADTAIKGISPSAYKEDQAKTAIGRVYLKELKVRQPQGDLLSTETFALPGDKE